jgi:hypothetical protein
MIDFAQLGRSPRVLMEMSASSFDFDNDRTEASDPVWRLLAQSKVSEPDPWFAVRTLARCRNEGLAAESRLLTLDRAWRWALGAGLGVCLGLFFISPRVQPASAPSTQGVQEAFEIIASMEPDADASASSSNSSSWQDSSL